MNNLYGWAMSEYVPYGGFKWLKNTDKFDIMSISDKSAIGSILEVDLEYPLAPKIFAVSNDMLLNYCKNIADKYEIKVGDVKKINSKFR